MNANFGKLKLAAVLGVTMLLSAGVQAQDAPPAPEPAPAPTAPSEGTPPPRPGDIKNDPAAATPAPANANKDAKPAMPSSQSAANGMNMMGSLINLPAPVLENGLGLSRYQKSLVDNIRTRYNAARGGGQMAPSDWAILGTYAGDMGGNSGATSPDAQADWEIRSILTPEQRQWAGDGIGAVMVLEKYGIPAPLAGKLNLSAEQKKEFAEWGMKKWGEKGFGEWNAKDAPKPVEPAIEGTKTEVAGQEREPQKTPPQALKNPALEVPLFPADSYYNPSAGEYSLTFFEDNEFYPFLMEAGIKGDQALVLKKLTPIQRRMVAEFWWSDKDKEMRQMAASDWNRI